MPALIGKGSCGFSEVGQEEVGHVFVSNLIFFLCFSDLGAKSTQTDDDRPEWRSDAVYESVKVKQGPLPSGAVTPKQAAILSF